MDPSRREEHSQCEDSDTTDVIREDRGGGNGRSDGGQTEEGMMVTRLKWQFCEMREKRELEWVMIQLIEEKGKSL